MFRVDVGRSKEHRKTACPALARARIYGPLDRRTVFFFSPPVSGHPRNIIEPVSPRFRFLLVLPPSYFLFPAVLSFLLSPSFGGSEK